MCFQNTMDQFASQYHTPTLFYLLYTCYGKNAIRIPNFPFPTSKSDDPPSARTSSELQSH